MLYSRQFLEQRIKEEQFRTYRTGSPFSVVLFNPFRLFSYAHISRKKTIDLTVKLLDQETRETDIKGWWNRRTFAVLLLDTSSEKALLFIDKLVSKVQENRYSGVELVRKPSFKIISFPNNGRPKSDGKDNNDKKKDLKGPKNYSNKDDHKIKSLINVTTSDFSTGNGFKKHQEYIKRCLDIVVSLTGLVILSPLFLLCALLIKLDSRGPVFFKQTRVGQEGKSFTFLKFRSMNHNADQGIHKNHIKNLMNHTAGLSSNGRPDEKTYKLVEDHRVTWVGKFLRRASIDELPQLINVLKGDITLVGPRPHPIYEVKQYNLWHRHRLDVKPGVTGLGQIRGRFNMEYEDVYRLDIRYLKKWSLFSDLKILFKTVPIVLSRRGAV